MIQKHNQTGNVTIWSVVKGAALVALAALVIKSLPDIRRYIRISNM